MPQHLVLLLDDFVDNRRPHLVEPSYQGMLFLNKDGNSQPAEALEDGRLATFGALPATSDSVRRLVIEARNTDRTLQDLYAGNWRNEVEAPPADPN